MVLPNTSREPAVKNSSYSINGTDQDAQIRMTDEGGPVVGARAPFTRKTSETPVMPPSSEADGFQGGRLADKIAGEAKVLTDSDYLKGEWKDIKGHVLMFWSRLTDNDLKDLEGRWEILRGKVQKIYGYTKEQMDAEFGRFKKSVTHFLNRNASKH